MTNSREIASLILSNVYQGKRLDWALNTNKNLAKLDSKTQSKNKDPDTAILERQLSESLGAKINIKHSKSGGVISIKYSTMNELQGIIEKIRNTNKN